MKPCFEHYEKRVWSDCLQCSEKTMCEDRTHAKLREELAGFLKPLDVEQIK